MKPIAIDLFCGLGLFQPEFINRANFTIKKFMACWTKNPNHVTLHISSSSPSTIAFMVWAMRNFQDAFFSTGFARSGYIGTSALESIDRCVFIFPFLFIQWPALLIFSPSPNAAKFPRGLASTFHRAISLICIRRHYSEVLSALPAICAIFRSAFVLISSNSPSALRAVITAPFSICAPRRKLYAT